IQVTPPSETSGQPGRDQNGGPMPVGAVARIGTAPLQHSDRISSLAFSPDGQLIASVGNDTTVRVWDVRTGKETRRLKRNGARDGHIVFSPDGEMIAVAAHNFIQLWNLQKSEEPRTLGGHRDYITALLFSPDSQQLLSAGQDGVIRRWD